VDNGREFTGHEELTSKLGVDVYFAHSYHSWERGLNDKWGAVQLVELAKSF
jgi:IS30 family transposase